MSRLAILVLCAAAVVGGCERRKGGAEHYKQAEDWGQGDPSDPHAEVAPQDDPHAGIDMSGGGEEDPHAGMEPPADREVDPNKFLAGTIVLTDLTRGKVPQGAVVFIAAKAPGGGPPLAVERRTDSTFPMEFRLDQADQMMAGTDFAGPVVISVRVDQDSDVGTRQPGDLYATLEATIPASGLELKLDTVEP